MFHTLWQDASDALSARAACRSWRAAGEHLRHPRLTVYTDNDEQLLRCAEGLRTSMLVRCPVGTGEQTGQVG